MPSRINHVKMVTPEPAVVDAFLREVCDLPEGWPLGGTAPLEPGAPLGPGGALTQDDVMNSRGGATGGGFDGFITGDPVSRQVQIFSADRAVIWAVCISTRHIEAAYEKAQARGVPCTTIDLADWNEHDNIRVFFARVGGLMFEVIRVEPKT